jgi:hypothetical protein
MADKMFQGWYSGSTPMQQPVGRTYRHTHEWVSNGEERAECCVCWCKDGGYLAKWPCNARVPRITRYSPPKD